MRSIAFMRATLFAASLLIAATVRAAAPVEYRFSFPDAVHHVMQVEATFRDVPAGTLRLQMSRSSPGRYATFGFAKNLFDERITDGGGNALAAARPSPREWDVAAHDGTVRITYKLYGNRIDGTFAGIDERHAHVNMPAALVWAHGFEDRPARLTFVPPPGSGWKIATQLYATSDPLTFTAPNLQYLMDSPVEASAFTLRTFTVPAREANGKAQTFRVAMHIAAADADLDAYVAGVRRIVAEEQAVFGELPDFEPGAYTLIGDYVPGATFEGMEHRNSCVLTSGRATLPKSRVGMLGEAAHEMFHLWNVERIRPASLEPFDFTDANISGELWLAEGFTNYYGRLVMVRSGITEPIAGITGAAGEVGGVFASPAMQFRSAVDVSRLAPLTDGGVSPDPTYWENTSVSYYSVGDVIALALDLTLRARSDSRVSLDDFMRAMWREHGKPGGAEPGLVRKPYTMADVRARLAEVSGDRVFADDFVRRYIEGHERADYAALLLRAGFVLRNRNAGQPALGRIPLEKKEGAPLRVSGSTLIGSPAYDAGLDVDDELVAIGGTALAAPEDVGKALAGHKPGDEVEIVFNRHGQEVRSKARLAEDQQLEMVPIEKTGGALTDAQKRFRDAWLGTKATVSW